MLTKNVFVSMCVAVDGLARVVEVAATFYLHGAQKESRRCRWLVGAHGTLLHMQACTQTTGPYNKLSRLIGK